MRDLGIIGLSVVVAIILARSGVLQGFFGTIETFVILSSFIAGMFWTSAFTVAPASVVLIDLARTNHIFPVALAASVGAFFADLIIFRFIKDDLEEDIMDFIQHSRFHIHRFHFLWKLKAFRWMFSILGAIIIASPLPDDIGLMIMGLSKTNTHFFIITSVLLNFVGLVVMLSIFK